MSVSANSVPVSPPVDPNVQVLMETQKATNNWPDKLMDIMLKQASGQVSSRPTSGQQGLGQARGSSDSTVGQYQSVELAFTEAKKAISDVSAGCYGEHASRLPQRLDSTALQVAICKLEV